VLELDHAFCLVSDPARSVRQLEADGWGLDAGQVHRGQGTRNRRVLWAEHYFELLWVIDAAEARSNPLRLDRRADWTASGASPFGLGFRGLVAAAEMDEFWLYDALGPRIWIHQDNEHHPERPLVFVLEADEQQMQLRRRQRRAMSEAMVDRPGELREVRLRGPSAPSLPPYSGPPIRYEAGPNRLELVISGERRATSVSDVLIVRAQPATFGDRSTRPRQPRLRQRLGRSSARATMHPCAAGSNWAAA
jgi:hypothetical protein